MRGQRADDQVGAVSRSDDQAARGQRVEEVRQHRPAEDEVERVTGQPGVVAEQHPRAQRVTDLRDGRRGERGLVGQHVAGHGQPGREPGGDLLPVVRGHPVGHHGEDVAAEDLVRPVGVTGLREHGLHRLLAAADDRDHGRAELVREACVEGEFVRELGVGVVRSQNEDDLVVAGDAVEPLDEGGDQFVRPLFRLEGGGLVVVHAVDGGRILRQPVARTQQLEEPVGPVVDEGTEHAHPVDLPGQELHDSQLDDLTAVAAVDSGHVHAAGHASSPSLYRGLGAGHKNRPPR